MISALFIAEAPALAGFSVGATTAWIDKQNTPTFAVPDVTINSSYTRSSRAYGLHFGYQRASSPWVFESALAFVSTPLLITAQSGPVTAEGTASITSLQIPLMLRWTRFNYLTFAVGGYSDIPLSIKESGDIDGLTLEYDWGITAGLRFEAPLFQKRITLSSELRINQGVKSFDGNRSRDHLLLIGISLGTARK